MGRSRTQATDKALSTHSRRKCLSTAASTYTRITPNHLSPRPHWLCYVSDVTDGYDGVASAKTQAW